MANKAHIWSKNDKITAERLNTMSKTINSLVDGGISSDDTNDKPHGDSDTSNWANAIDDAQPVLHEYANHVGYRHPVYGTADLYDNSLPIGMYATSPAIIDANGDIERDINHFGCMPCYLTGGECAQTVYLRYYTDQYGQLLSGSSSASYHVGDICEDVRWYGLNAGTGIIYQPIARIAPDPKFPCQMQAMHYSAVQIPLKADNAAYLPPYKTGQRGIQGMIFADPPEANIVPIRGLNNHGGVKILPDYDTDGQRRSNGVMASPELYGRATTEEHQQSIDDGTCDIYGPYTPTGSAPWYFRQPYNSMYPFASGDGGVLAKWPIYQPPLEMVCGHLVPGSPVQVGEISLIGGHVGNNDWQLWFEGQGQIMLPPSEYSTVGSAYINGPITVGSTPTGSYPRRPYT